MEAPLHQTPPPAPPRQRRSGWVIGLVVGLVTVVLFGCTVLFIAAAFSGDSVGGEAVAVIHLEGPITGGRGGIGEATPERIISQLRQADQDDRVRSVLLRIESPGGTVAASEEIAMEVARMKKPVVASIGDLGASGAYMVAVECDEIMAAPSSAVGSIGVIQTFPNVEGLLDKLGVRFTTLHEGEFKDAGSPYRDLTPEEKQRFQASMREVYDAFIKRVATARDLPEAEVRKLATGWVWNGTRAQELKLVDTLGNYTDGLRAAGRRGNIEGFPETVDYESGSFADVLRSLLSVTSKIPGIGAGQGLDRAAVPQAR